MVEPDSANTALFDIIGVGIAAVDNLVFVDDYRPADHKRSVRRRERHLGGLTATPLVAASRLGCKCAYMGALGDDELSRTAIDGLNREGVNTDYLAFHSEARPIHSTIVIGRMNHTRNIFPRSRKYGAPILNCQRRHLFAKCGYASLMTSPLKLQSA